MFIVNLKDHLGSLSVIRNRGVFAFNWEDKGSFVLLYTWIVCCVPRSSIQNIFPSFHTYPLKQSIFDPLSSWLTSKQYSQLEKVKLSKSSLDRTQERKLLLLQTQSVTVQGKHKVKHQKRYAYSKYQVNHSLLKEPAHEQYQSCSHPQNPL